jgi:hypothetical protein
MYFSWPNGNEALVHQVFWTQKARIFKSPLRFKRCLQAALHTELALSLTRASTLHRRSLHAEKVVGAMGGRKNAWGLVVFAVITKYTAPVSCTDYCA